MITIGLVQGRQDRACVEDQRHQWGGRETGSLAISAADRPSLERATAT